MLGNIFVFRRNRNRTKKIVQVQVRKTPSGTMSRSSKITLENLPQKKTFYPDVMDFVDKWITNH